MASSMTETKFIVAGRFIDGAGNNARRNVFLTVQDAVITAIAPVADLPHNSPIEDLSHCIILPPLVDCSVSLARSPSVDSGVRLAAAGAGRDQRVTTLARHISDCHAHGVLGVAEGEDITDLLERYQSDPTREDMIEIRTAGGLCRNRADCPADSLPDRDFLKIGYSADIDDEKPPTFSLNPADLAGILKQRGKRKAVVVANGHQQVAEALAAGCDAIEQGYGMGEDNLREMAAKAVLWIPSVIRAGNGLAGASSAGEVCCRFSQRYVAPGKPNPGAEAFWRQMLAGQLAQLRLARSLGVVTAVGTGAGNIGILHGESMVEEMKLFIKAGYSLTEAIHCASETGARFFGMDHLGALKVGSKATFLITRGAAPQLPRKLSYLEGIYVDGLPSPTYRKNPGRPA